MTSKLGAKDVVLHAEAAADLDGLDRSRDKVDVTNRAKVRGLRPTLLRDCLHGEVVPRSKIPRALKLRYGIDNLYVEDIAGWRRLLYTIRKEGGERFVIVLRIVTHAEYDRWFPNKGK